MNNNGMMYHIGLRKESIEGATIAIVPGDPGRVPDIASYLENSKKIGVNREYTSYLGKIDDQNILVISSGMGGPSTAICVEELYQIGIKTIIRVGTCGGIDLDVDPGDLVIAQATVRQEGTSKEYMPVEYPAVGDHHLLNYLENSCKKLGYKYHIGVVQSKDSFYGQHDPNRMPVSYELNNKWDAWKKSGVLASEMEIAAFYCVARFLKMKAAAILLSVWNQEQVDKGIIKDNNFDTSMAIKTVINAIKDIIKDNN